MATMTDSSLEDIKVGDFVSRFHNGQFSDIRKVEKVTKTRIFINSGEKFDRNGMLMPRQRWTYISIKPTTQEHRDQMHRYKLLHAIKQVNWEECPLELLSRVLGMIESEIKDVS